MKLALHIHLDLLNQQQLDLLQTLEQMNTAWQTITAFTDVNAALKMVNKVSVNAPDARQVTWVAAPPDL